MKTNRSIAEVLESLEAQAAFHEERETFHAGQETHHREQRSGHAARLEEIRRRLEAFRAAAAEALDMADQPVIRPAEEEVDLGPDSRPRLGRMVGLVLKLKRPGERFGPVTLCEEVNRRFGERLRRPFDAGQISVVLRRMSRMGKIHLVRRGRPHWEALYVQEAPGS